MGFFIDPSSLDAGFQGSFQVLFLGAVYSYVLYNASNLISEGSELLLLVPAWEKLVGSIVLPILGAVPDGAMVLFSGMGNNAKEEITVGVGTLAGSTVMLLTIPYAISIFNGMVPAKANGGPDYSKRNTKLNSYKDGSTGNPKLIRMSGFFMGLTMLSYLVVQLPASYFKLIGYSAKTVAQRTSPYIIGGITICLTLFIYYIYHCYSATGNTPNNAVVESKQREKAIELLKSGLITIEESFDRILEENELLYHTPKSARTVSPQIQKPLLKENTELRQSVKKILQPLFDEIDYDDNNYITYEEGYALLHKLNQIGKGHGESVTKTDDLRYLFQLHDVDKNGGLDIDEFTDLVWSYVERRSMREDIKNMDSTLELKPLESAISEEHEIPEDLRDMSHQKQQRTIIIRAMTYLAMGTLLVLSFSDPMVGVLNELGGRSGIPAFYLAFIVAPMASNAAEAVASTRFSMKKSAQTMEVSLSALVGAAIMNNTFCLLVFLVLVYYQKMEWTFGPEVLSIIFVEIIMLFYTQKRFYNWKDACIILSLYPISLLMVALMK